MEKYNLTQTGPEVQGILNESAPQSDLAAETERAELAETTLQGNIDIEERDRKAADVTLQGNIDAEKIRAKAAEKQNADDIDALEEKVPSGASLSNKLATEEYVNDLVSTATATFRGTFNLVSDLHLTLDATEFQIATQLALAIATADNNDYCFIQVPTSSETPTEIKEIDRYKFNGTAWSFEYKLNNSGFTAAQWAAINSGITSGDVTKLSALPTNAQLTALLAGKQDVLTFDNVPTEGSSHPVKSGGVYSAINDEKTARETADISLSSSIEAILLLIPSAATSLNKLADKSFVNSSIATASATFRGTYNLVTNLSLTVSATHAQIATALAGAVSDEDNNDYAFVQIPTSDATPTQIAKTERYKFNGTAWEYEYDLNNSGYTAAQWAAINSGITEALVTKLSALPTNADLTTALGVLTSSITTINQKIPSAASQSNQLVDTAAMESYIVQVLDVLTASFNVTSTDGHVTVSISQVDGKITSVSVSTSDIASAASLSLIAGRVTTTEGNISTNAADIANLQDAYAALTQSALVVVQPTDTWPVASPATSTIYRVVDRVNTPPQNYSDYMWNGTTMVLMAQYDNAIDDVPTAGSNNLVKSGGVLSTVNKVYSFTPLYDKYNNIVQKEDITRENGLFIKDDGAIDGDAAYAITDYINISGCSTLKWHGYLPSVAKNVAAIAFYDNNKIFINAISVGTSGTYTSAQTDITVTNIPANAAYVRCSTEKGFDVFYIWGDNLRKAKEDYAINATVTKHGEGFLRYVCSICDKTGNIVQKEDITRENGIFIEADGTIGDDAACGITDYINIKGCKRLNWHGYLPVAAKSVAAVAFYDENKIFISSVSVGNASSGSTYTTFQTDIIITSIPANAAYVIACTEKNCDEFYLETDVSNIDLLRNQIKNSSEINFDNTVKYCDLKIVKETPGLTSIIHNWGFIGDSLCSGEIAYTFTATPNILHYLDCYPFSYGQRIVKAIGGRGVNYSSGGLTTKAWWQKYIENQNSGWTEDGSSSVFSTNNHSAYIIAIGTNDANQQVNAGSISDINLSDYTQNADTFAGNYGKIIQKIREINHRSPIFLIIYPSMLMSDKYDTIIKQLVTLFTGVFLIDLRTDLSLAKIDISPYFFGGHLTTQGYQFFAYVLMNEIDNIIRTNMQYFNKQALIGTSVQNEDIIW